MLLIRRLIFLLLVSCAALAAHFLSTTPQTYWFILSTLLLSLIEMGDTFFRRVSVIVITGLTVSIIVYVTGMLSGHLILLAIVLAVITICCVFVSGIYPQYFLLALIINLCAILSGSLSATMPECAERMLNVVCGMALVALLQIIYLPGFTRSELRLWLNKTLANLELCNKEIFSCFLSPEYVNNLYLYERRIHTQKVKFMQSLNKSRDIIMDTTLKIASSDRDTMSQWLIKIEYIYTIILDCAQLRRRVTDHTVFGLCANEMDGISHEVTAIILELIKVLAGNKGKVNAIALSVRIKHLDDNYQNVLRITAREPLVFVLFISSLKILNDELMLLYQNTSSMSESLERV